MSDLMQSMQIAAGGLSAQSARMKMTAENIANADSIIGPGQEAYRAKQMLFRAEVDRQTGLTHVKIDRVIEDHKTPLKHVYEPGHVLADANGFVTYPNVNTAAEAINMREATRMYEANLQTVQSAKEMMARSMDLLR